jgi:hypothetical protein
VAPLVCDVCHEPITKGGNLEWVELPNGEVRDVRMVHKWSCVAKRSVEYAKDRGEVQWVPLPRRPSVHTLATILQGASPEQVGEAARRMGISHPYTALLAALAQQAAHQQGRSPEFRARQGI